MVGEKQLYLFVCDIFMQVIYKFIYFQHSHELRVLLKVKLNVIYRVFQ